MNKFLIGLLLFACVALALHTAEAECIPSGGCRCSVSCNLWTERKAGKCRGYCSLTQCCPKYG